MYFFFSSICTLAAWQTALLAYLAVLAECGHPTNRTGAVRCPESTFHGPVPRDQSRHATLRRVFLKRGRRPAIVVASMCARDERRPGPFFCALGLGLAATSSFLPRKSERNSRQSRDSRTQRPVALAEARSSQWHHCISGPIGHQFRSAHGLSADGQALVAYTFRVPLL